MFSTATNVQLKYIHANDQLPPQSCFYRGDDIRGLLVSSINYYIPESIVQLKNDYALLHLRVNAIF
jgi:hypothetical protein